MKKRIRLSPEVSKLRILETALKISAKVGYQNITRLMVCKKLKISTNLISYHFGCVDEFRKQIVVLAIEKEEYSVLSQWLVSKDDMGLRISMELKKKVAEFIIG